MGEMGSSIIWHNARGGMVVRDHWGKLILAAAFSYGNCSNMEAELRALSDGLVLLERYNLLGYKIQIETDSEVMVRMVLKGHHRAWKFWGLLRQILERM